MRSKGIFSIETAFATLFLVLLLSSSSFNTKEAGDVLAFQKTGDLLIVWGYTWESEGEMARDAELFLGTNYSIEVDGKIIAEKKESENTSELANEMHIVRDGKETKVVAKIRK